MIPRFRSIVSRIVWLHVMAIGASTAAVIIATYLALGSTASNFQDQVLRDHADTIALYLAVDADGHVELRLPSALAAVYTHAFGGFAYAVVDRSGTALFSSRPNGEPVLQSDPRQDSPFYFQRSQRRPLYYGASIPKRIDGRELWIQVAQDLEHPDAIVDDIVADFLRRVAWFTMPIMLALAAIDIVVVRRALRPVLNASERARTINPAMIDLRLPTERLPVEILPLVEAINKALDRLEAGFRAQREFTADAAHELRTPLSVLRMRIDTLSDRVAAAELRTDVEAMSRIVEQLLAMSELEHFPVDLTDIVNLQEVCGEVVALIAPIALAQGKEIALVGVREPVLIMGDRHGIFQAVRNLAENAVEHTAQRSTVEILVQSDGSVRVLDKGPGVADEMIPHLFRRFWRGDHRRTKGAGLGLSIVARIAEAHGGAIKVENRIMGGAAFVLTLPLAGRGRVYQKPESMPDFDPADSRSSPSNDRRGARFDRLNAIADKRS